MNHKKLTSTLICMLLFFLSISCGRYAGYKEVSQDEAWKTNPEYARTIRKKEILRNAPSNLELSAILHDDDSLLPNGCLDAEEEATIKVTIQNTKNDYFHKVGKAFDVICKINSNNPSVIIYNSRQTIGDLMPSESYDCEFSVRILPDASDGKVLFTIYAEESRRNFKAPLLYKEFLVKHLDKPSITWIYPRRNRVEIVNEVASIRAVIKSESNIEEYKILVNGIEVNKNGRQLNAAYRGKTRITDPKISRRNRIVEFTIAADIQLLPLEDSEIAIYAKNKSIGVTFKQTRKIYYKVPKFDLYVLSIGISDYRNADLQLKYADKDARAVCDMFKTQKGKIFNNVFSKELYNYNATRSEILNGLRWLQRKRHPNDIAILFIAGHGTVDYAGNFFFVPSDGSLENHALGVTQDDIFRVLNNIPGTKIVLIDACRSGAILGESYTVRGGRDVNDAIKLIASTEDDIIIYTASTGRGFSQERKEWGHGAFTKALIAGLKYGEADNLNNGIIYLPQLNAFVTQYVYNITQKKQKPQMFKSAFLPIFQWK